MLAYIAHYTEKAHPPHGDLSFWFFIAGLVLVIVAGLWFNARRPKKSPRDLDK